MARKVGFTLAEVLVAMGIGSLLLTAVVYAFVATGRLMNWVGVHSDVSTSGLVAMTRWSQELRSSSYQTMTIVSTPRLAMGLAVEDPTTITLTTFQASKYFVLYYDDGAGHLQRKTWNGSTPDTATLGDDPFAVGRLSSGDITAILAVPNGTEHTEATGVTAVAVVPATFPMVGGSPQPVDGIALNLTVQQSVTSQQAVSQTYQTTVYPRNHP